MVFWAPDPTQAGYEPTPRSFPVETGITFPNFQNAQLSLPNIQPVYDALNDLLGSYKKKDVAHQKEEATRLFGYAAQESQGSIDQLRKLVQERGLLAGSNPAFIARTHELYAEQLASAYQADLLAGMGNAAQVRDPQTGQLTVAEVSNPVTAYADYAHSVWQKYANDPISSSEYGGAALYEAKNEVDRKAMLEFVRQRAQNRQELGANLVKNKIGSDIATYASIDNPSAEDKAEFLRRIQDSSTDAYGFGVLDVRSLGLKAAQDVLLGQNIDPKKAWQVIDALREAKMGVELGKDVEANSALDELALHVSTRQRSMLSLQEANLHYQELAESSILSAKFMTALSEANQAGLPLGNITSAIDRYIYGDPNDPQNPGRPPVVREALAKKKNDMLDTIRKGSQIGSPGYYANLSHKISTDRENIDVEIASPTFNELSERQQVDLVQRNEKLKNASATLRSVPVYREILSTLKSIPGEFVQRRTAVSTDENQLIANHLQPIVTEFQDKAFALAANGLQASAIGEELKKDTTAADMRKEASKFLAERDEAKRDINERTTRKQEVLPQLVAAASRGLISRAERAEAEVKAVDDPTRLYGVSGADPGKRIAALQNRVTRALIVESQGFAKFDVTGDVIQHALRLTRANFAEALVKIRSNPSVAADQIPALASEAMGAAISKAAKEALSGQPDKTKPATPPK